MGCKWSKWEKTLLNREELGFSLTCCLLNGGTLILNQWLSLEVRGLALAFALDVGWVCVARASAKGVGENLYGCRAESKVLFIKVSGGSFLSQFPVFCICRSCRTKLRLVPVGTGCLKESRSFICF